MTPQDLDDLAELQYRLVLASMRFAGQPSCDKVKHVVDLIWSDCRGNRAESSTMTVESIRYVMEATLRRCLTILEAGAEPNAARAEPAEGAD